MKIENKVDKKQIFVVKNKSEIYKTVDDETIARNIVERQNYNGKKYDYQKIDLYSYQNSNKFRKITESSKEYLEDSFCVIKIPRDDDIHKSDIKLMPTFSGIFYLSTSSEGFICLHCKEELTEDIINVLYLKKSGYDRSYQYCLLCEWCRENKFGYIETVDANDVELIRSKS